MTASHPRPAASTTAATQAFLRGVERRGAVLAELQCGDAAAGDAALATALVQFGSQCTQWNMSEWPTRFWGLLLAQPGLRVRTGVALPLSAGDELAGLGSGPRAALLLRLAAGLPGPQAAAVLGISEASYRLALQRALPRDADGLPDPRALQRLRDDVQRRIKALPPGRLLGLVKAREQALAGVEPDPGSPARQRPLGAGRRALLAALWVLLALCAVALAATYVWLPGPNAADPPASRVQVQALAPEASAASRYGPQAAVPTHPDFTLLRDPDGMAAASDLAFYSWLAATDPPKREDDATEASPPIAGSVRP